MSKKQLDNLSQANFNTVEEYRSFVQSRLSSLKDDNTRRDVMHAIQNGQKFPNPNGILNKWMEQACGGDTHLTYEPHKNLDFEAMQDALSNKNAIEFLAKGLSNYVFGGSNPNDYISPKHDMKVENIVLPDVPKSEKAPFLLTTQKLKEITTNPIIPLCRKDDYLVMLGKDTATDEAVVFLTGMPSEDAHKTMYRDTEMPFFLYVGGVQPKFLGRTSYSPTTTKDDCHRQMHIENGRISRDKDGALVMDKFESKVLHYHSYLQEDDGHLPTIITNPLHYTALVREQDNDYLPQETATCQQALLHMFSKFNVLTQDLEQWSDDYALDFNLQNGALVALGIMDSDADFSKVELNAQLYDLVLPYYQNFVKTGEKDYDVRTLYLLGPENAELAEEELGPRESVLPSNDASGQQIIDTIKQTHNVEVDPVQ